MTLFAVDFNAGFTIETSLLCGSASSLSVVLMMT